MHSLTFEFSENQKKYNDFRLKVEGLVRELLIQNNISYHKIESRVKDIKKLDEKISQKNKYKSLSEITDLVGLRVITYFEDEVDKVSEIIDKEFVRDPKNSIDKRIIDSDKFGYRSLHQVVSLNRNRQNLTEYKRFKNIKFEIQIRSILQHAWAEIEHDLGYKSENAIPAEFKRSFYRVAALLETADLDFLKIRDGLEKYEIEVAQKIEENPDKVEINSASLKSFIEESDIVKTIDNLISKKTKTPIKGSYHDDESNVERLEFVNVLTIKQLEDMLKENGEEIASFAEVWTELDEDDPDGGSFSKGISIFYLAYYLLGKKQDFSKALDYVIALFDLNENTREENEKFARDILETYSKISSKQNNQ